jgi:hypothetical protein
MSATPAQAVLHHMLHQSLEAPQSLGENRMAVLDYQDAANILRMRVLEGEEISAVEMLYICNQIRQGRRTAAAKEKASPRAKAAPRKAEVLTDLLDQDL